MNYHLANMTSSTEFPVWLQAELDKRGWRPTDLAKRAKISDAAVSRFLSGARTPDAESLAAMAKAMKIRPEKAFLVAIGEDDESESDEWVEETSNKIKLVPSSLRGITDKFIDSMLQGQESQPKAKSKVKSAKA